MDKLREYHTWHYVTLSLVGGMKVILLFDFSLLYFITDILYVLQ